MAVAGLFAVLLAGLLAVSPATRAAAPAGASIGNQASATYQDSSNTTRTVTSNLVSTLVEQVASVDLATNLSRTSTPGGQVSFPVTLTNNGNGDDSFSLSLSQSGSFLFSSVAFYADANADGIPDGGAPITLTGLVSAGAVFHFVAVGTVPGSASPGNTNSLVITGTSGFNATVSDSVTDTTTITANAVVNVSKSMSATSGDPGSGPHTITLTYTNTGNSTATAVRVTDLLPAGFVYVPGSARWSATGPTVLTDAFNTDSQGLAPDTVIYDFGVTAAGQATAVLNQVVPGQSGNLSFQVSVSGTAAPGNISNTAAVSYNDGSGGTVGPFATNTYTFTVNQVAGLTLAGDTVASAAQGSTVTFGNALVNTGNGTDSFDITLGASSFPAGTSFLLYQSDGVSPLLDTNGNSIPDTGSVAPGGSYTIVLRAILPSGATGGPFSVDKTATSFADPSESATASDVLTGISASSVDLTNDSTGPGSPGYGPGPETSPVTTNSVAPNATTRFTLYVTNGSTVSDTFNLAASTDPSFGSIVLPVGWSVSFRNAGNTVITNTGGVAPGGSVLVYADVTVPAGASPVPSPGQSLYFQAISPTTLALDRKHDAVIVSTVRDVTIVPNNTGQVFPGGTVVYTHTVSNNGNVDENDGTLSTVTLGSADSQAGFTSLVYLDANGNGILDATDPIVNTAADLGILSPGASRTVLVKVTAPAGAASGTINATTVTATTAGTINGAVAPPAVTATDTSTVIAGNVSFLKEQGLDADCDDAVDSAFTTGILSAAPGECVQYRLTATNIGTADVTLLVIGDAVPSNTTYFYATPAGRAGTTVGTITAEPVLGGTGTITADVGTLLPGGVVIVTYGVQLVP